ncbi:MAPEG family protein [Psychrosphaera ytuae]|uniref:MAPEG family protein n=1 Tax=Psychrosphaera ytuae TaxID=2820710 RepID=A0A975DCQ7_9GAMM|nr:MAPEG family protein [Psychrosphaera ytuae]QTH64747.1 MAPEG family protein [Psychrosphaera ytuae]
MTIQYTALYAGLLALFYVALSFRIIRMRLKFKIGIGHGEQNELHRAIRVHANFAEYVPLALILLVFLEINQTASWILNVLGTALLIGRVLHAMGLGKSAGTSAARLLGGVLTYSMMLVAAVLNVLAVY